MAVEPRRWRKKLDEMALGKSSLRVMIFIDFSNLNAGERLYRRNVDHGFRLELVKLIERLADGRQYIETHIYRSNRKDPTPEELTNFQQLISSHKIFTHPFKRRKREKRVDVALALDVVGKSGKYDVAVIVSGDEDFIPAAERIEKVGKGVEIASFRTQLSPCWKDFADRIWLLDLHAGEIERR